MHSDHHLILPHWIVSTALLAGCLGALPVRAPAADPYQAAGELRAQYAANLEELAKWCDGNGLAEEARKTRRAIDPHDPYKIYMPMLPEQVGPAKLPASAPANVAEWDKRLSQLRREHATTLYEMARRQVRSRHEGLAFELMLASIQANPDYEPVRRLLGYQKFHDPKLGDQWRSLYEVKKLRGGFVWSDQFGWVAKRNIRRYEQGERLCSGRWVSTEDDAQAHRDIKSGWNVETEHYKVQTDHSIEAGVALGVKLERLYRLWSEIFLCFYASEADVQNLFDGRAKQATTLPRHNIVFLRDREDYLQLLKPSMQGIEISCGVYIPDHPSLPRAAYFYAEKPSDDRTLFHESTHQLFNESRSVCRDIGGRANFWIVEGIAMFMESLHEEDGYYVLGGPRDVRFNDARVRLLRDKFYVPLAAFAGKSRQQFQHDPQVATLYSQAAGLTHFLIFGEGGRYRDALVQYLVAVYTGRDNADTLAQLTGEKFDSLDAKYRTFMTECLQALAKR
jgi:hypothetical protein